MQTKFNLNKDEGFAGLLATNEFIKRESYVATEIIPLGSACVKNKAAGLDKSVRLPMFDMVVITDDAGTFTAGSISATVTYNVPNGASVATTYTQAWGTDKATTMAALAAKIAANAGVDTCVYDGSGHTITLVANADYNLSAVTVDVSGVTGTMTISTVAHTCNDVIEGISLFSQKEQESTGVVQYNVGDIVPVLRKGSAFIPIEESVTSNDSIYVRVYAETNKPRGQFLKTSTVTTVTINTFGKIALTTGFKFKKTLTAAGNTIVEINLP
jgi:hypothetical protein